MREDSYNLLSTEKTQNKKSIVDHELGVSPLKNETQEFNPIKLIQCGNLCIEHIRWPISNKKNAYNFNKSQKWYFVSLLLWIWNKYQLIDILTQFITHPNL